MSVTREDLESMRGQFEPCTCGSTDKGHQHVRLTVSNRFNWVLNVSDQWWAGTDEHGMWWATGGTGRARYFPRAEVAKAMAATDRLHSAIEGSTLWVHPAVIRESRDDR